MGAPASGRTGMVDLYAYGMCSRECAHVHVRGAIGAGAAHQARERAAAQVTLSMSKELPVVVEYRINDIGHISCAQTLGPRSHVCCWCPTTLSAVACVIQVAGHGRRSASLTCNFASQHAVYSREGEIHAACSVGT